MLETTDLRDTEKPLTDRELKLIDAWWRAANYLSGNAKIIVSLEEAARNSSR